MKASRWNASLMRSGMLKASPLHGTLLPSQMIVVLMERSDSPTVLATKLMFMTLCVAPVSI